MRQSLYPIIEIENARLIFSSILSVWRKGHDLAVMMNHTHTVLYFKEEAGTVKKHTSHIF